VAARLDHPAQELGGAVALGQTVLHGSIVWSVNVTSPRQIDVHHLGNPLVICCFQQDDVIVNCLGADEVDVVL